MSTEKSEFQSWHDLIAILKEENATVVARVEGLLVKAEEQVRKTRKRHETGAANESHLSYAEGLRDGIAEAFAKVTGTK